MTVVYTLDENDYLTHQLFLASQSERIKKKRQASKVRIPVIYLALGLILLDAESYFSAIAFFVIAVLWFLFYPLRERQRYLKHYKEFIAENYTKEVGKEINLEINDDFIVVRSDGSEGKLATKEVMEIAEIPAMIFIRLGKAQSYILPADKIPDFDTLRNELQQLAAKLGIEYNVHGDWAWK